MVEVAEIVALQLDLAENSWSVATRSSGEFGLASRRRCSSLPSLVESYQYSFWFLGTLRCYVLFHDTSSRSTDLLDCDLWVLGVLFHFPFPWVQILL
jgi:hypothetical protein